MGEIRAAIPARFFVRETGKGIYYMIRDFVIAAGLWYAATFIDPFGKSAPVVDTLTPVGAEVLRWSLWGVYWWFQGLNFVRFSTGRRRCRSPAYNCFCSDHRLVFGLLATR